MEEREDEFVDIPELSSCIKSAEYINTYDYNKMMQDYEFNMRHADELRKIKKKWVDRGRQFKQTIKRMEMEREEMYQKKNQKLLQKMNDKNKTLLTALESSRKSKLALKQKCIEELAKKEEAAKQAVERNLKQQEIERQAFEKMTNEKIESFIERNIEIKKEKHEAEVKKNEDSEKRHDANMVVLNEHLEKLKEQSEEKAFNKYVGFYWHKKEVEKNHRARIKAAKDKLNEKAEILERLEQEKEKQKKELIKKLKEMAKKKEMSEKEKAAKLQEEKRKRDEYFKKCLDNKEALKEEEKERRNDILEYQKIVFSRALNKDNMTNLKRINAGEKIVMSQMNLENSLNKFYKKMNDIKNNSILKKSPEERLAMYKEKKREEAEAKKKELEDKQNK